VRPAHSADELLQLPVRLHGIQLAQPTDLLIDVADWRAVGFIVVCGDGAERFLPFPTAKVRDGELAVGSPLMLLAETGFYRARAHSYRGLLGSTLAAGIVRGALIGVDGDVTELVVEAGGEERRVAPASAGERAA
jgi:hypothetical protein